MGCRFVGVQPPNHLDFWRHGSDIQWRFATLGFVEKWRGALREHNLSIEIQIMETSRSSGAELLAVLGSTQR